MTSCWIQAFLLSAQCLIDGVEEEQSIRARYGQAVAEAWSKRVFEYFDYTGCRDVSAVVGGSHAIDRCGR